MRSIFQMTGDMRALAQMIVTAADELDEFAKLFSGGPALASPFGQNLPSPQLPPAQLPPPVSGRMRKKRIAIPPEKKLLIRQLWFEAPKEEQTREQMRAISDMTGISYENVRKIIARTPPSDSSGSSMKPEPPSFAREST